MLQRTSRCPGESESSADPRAFLHQFTSASVSSTCACLAHGAARSSASTPGEVLAAIVHGCTERLAEPHLDAQRRADCEAILDALRDHEQEALAYAQHVLDWEGLPLAERQAAKSARSERYRRLWMAEQPATERQLAYLHNLGHAGEVADRAEASRLIDVLRGQREGRP